MTVPLRAVDPSSATECDGALQTRARELELPPASKSDRVLRIFFQPESGVTLSLPAPPPPPPLPPLPPALMKGDWLDNIELTAVPPRKKARKGSTRALHPGDRFAPHSRGGRAGGSSPPDGKSDWETLRIIFRLTMPITTRTSLAGSASAPMCSGLSTPCSHGPFSTIISRSPTFFSRTARISIRTGVRMSRPQPARVGGVQKLPSHAIPHQSRHRHDDPGLSRRHRRGLGTCRRERREARAVPAGCATTAGAGIALKATRNQ